MPTPTLTLNPTPPAETIPYVSPEIFHANPKYANQLSPQKKVEKKSPRNPRE